MSQHYSDPEREQEPTALPNVEVFYQTAEDIKATSTPFAGWTISLEECAAEAGWYWQSCFPGCLPDGDPCGPFETEAEAVADAQGE